MEIGDIVVCKEGDIDRGVGKGMTGYVEGFARLSSRHGREAFVRPAEGQSQMGRGGWFWVYDLEAAQ